ncbi:DNA damage-binding protein 1a [Dinochytrium kinnereticum]|nr:DNA damage-binding protein 1a [Dinochytrium kinnereticum]
MQKTPAPASAPGKRGLVHFSPGYSGRKTSFLSSGSLDAILSAAGAVVQAVDDIFEASKTVSAFCVVRPPGHHCGRNGVEPIDSNLDLAQGFCFVNNVGALHAVSSFNARVAIFDFDVHHGNGSEGILRYLLQKHKLRAEKDEEEFPLLFASTHQVNPFEENEDTFFPGTGNEVGEGDSIYDYLVNCPLMPGTGSTDFREIVMKKILPRFYAFKPDLILLSAGFDSHLDDTVGDLNLIDDDYEWIAEQFSSVQPRVISVLEGGYELKTESDKMGSLPRSCKRHVQATPKPDLAELRDQTPKLETSRRNDYCIYSWCNETSSLRFESRGDARDRNGAPAIGAASKCLIDPEGRFFALHGSEGALKIVTKFGEKSSTVKGSTPLSQLKRKASEIDIYAEIFPVRIQENKVICIQILKNAVGGKPVFAILHQDARDQRFIRLYELSLAEKELVPRSEKMILVELSSNIIIPLKDGGFIVVGDIRISRFDPAGNGMCNLDIDTAITCWTEFGQNAFDLLLGDLQGNLFGLQIDLQLCLKKIGETSIASCLGYLGDGLIFIGSHYGDSQLVQMSLDASLVDVESFSNLAPMVDFCVVDHEKQGQSQVVACCGVMKHGALRVIRNGIGIQEIAEMEVPGLQGIWSLTSQIHGDNDFILLSFFSESKLLGIDNDGEIAEVDGDIIRGEATLYCGDCRDGLFIQVTPFRIALMKKATFSIVAVWDPPSRINHVSANSEQVVLGRVAMPYEIACIDVSPLRNCRSSYCTIGLWTETSFRLLHLPSLAPFQTYVIGGDVLPRSALSVKLGDVNYIFIGLGDGQLLTFVLDDESGKLELLKSFFVGSQPLALFSFKVADKTNVFVSCDRPTVIYSGTNGKLVYSNINIRDAIGICPFRMSSYPSALAIATSTTLKVGLIDELQRLHIRTIPLRENPRRISHNQSQKVFGVVTTQFFSNGLEEKSYLRMLDEESFDLIASYNLEDLECAQSICCITFEEDSREYFAVGTAFSIDGEECPSKGRIIIFEVLSLGESRSLNFVTSTSVGGSVYSLVSFNGKLLATVNAEVQIFEWLVKDTTDERELVIISNFFGQTHSLYAATRGDFILIGDLMCSASLLTFNPVTKEISEIARDYSPSFTTAVEFLDDDHFIVSDHYENIYSLRKQSDVSEETEQRKLEIHGQFHLGDFITRYRNGSLVLNANDASDIITPTLLFSTRNGMIGVIAIVGDTKADMLHGLQRNLANYLQAERGLNYLE